MNKRIPIIFLTILLAGVPLSAPWSKAIEPTSTTGGESNSIGDIRPNWQVGDKWVIETRTRMIQERRTTESAFGSGIQWQFEVARREKINGVEAVVLNVKCLADDRPSPSITIVVDSDSSMIRSIRSTIPVGSGFHTITESYKTDSGQTSPILGPWPALPIDLPAFVTGAKGALEFDYQSYSGAGEDKRIGDLGFSFRVKQEERELDADGVKKLLHSDFTKEVAIGRTVEVNLRTAHRTVRQLWQQDLPWPMYSDNGSTVSRLVQTTRTTNR